MKQARHRKSNTTCSYLNVEVRNVGFIEGKSKIIGASSKEGVEKGWLMGTKVELDRENKFQCPTAQ
jgi:hypothetical protein